MNEEHRKPGLKKDAKNNLLNDLEDLSGMLDDEHQEIQKELTQPYDLEDLPVLKSFVEDVPTLNESLNEPEPDVTLTPPSDDDSFVDDDPLAISSAVRKKASSGIKPAQEPIADSQTAPPTLQSSEPAAQKADNPFLPKSALDRLKTDSTKATESKASQELRSLVKQRSLPNFDINSKEFLALRADASKMVTEVVKLFIPRMEAELRMRLEKEVDEYIKELRKNAED